MIITSLLDTDFYKLTMSQFLWRQREGLGDDDLVRFAFTNRTEVEIPRVVDMKKLKEEIDHLFNLGFTYSELCYLQSLGDFGTDYLDALSSHVPHGRVSYRLGESNGRLNLMIEGPWWVATLYETPCLAIINELYGTTINKSLLRGAQEEAMGEKLVPKIEFLKLNRGLRFIEFGTRRRYSRFMQGRIIETMQDLDFGPMLGTSNVYFAKKYSLQPMGTMAHEIPMGRAAEYLGLHSDARSDEEVLRQSQKDVFSEWLSWHPKTFWLTDTYGSKWFIYNVGDRVVAKEECGLRQDSGDPHMWLQSVHSRFETKKPIMFSDGLTPKTMRELWLAAKEYGFTNDQIFFGWGTNLTNDGVIKPLSIVIKLSQIVVKGRWYKTVKLSDNIKKAKGSDVDIHLYSKAFEYKNNDTIDEGCTY